MTGPNGRRRFFDWFAAAVRLRSALAGGASIIVMLWVSPLQADAAIGESLARQWCSSCHEVGHRPVANDGAPAFKAVARQPGMTRERLRHWLVDPHPPMPNLDLARQDIEDLIDYIETLKRK